MLLDALAPERPLAAQSSAHGAPVACTFDAHDQVVHFGAPQLRVAPGQVVALYDGDVVIGGGIASPTSST